MVDPSLLYHIFGEGAILVSHTSMSREKPGYINVRLQMTFDCEGLVSTPGGELPTPTITGIAEAAKQPAAVIDSVTQIDSRNMRHVKIRPVVSNNTSGLTKNRDNWSFIFCHNHRQIHIRHVRRRFESFGSSHEPG